MDTHNIQVQTIYSIFFFFSRQFIDFIPHKLYNQKLKLLKIWNEIICSLLNWLHLYSSSPLIKRFFYPFFYIQYTCLDEPAHPRRQAIISIQTIFNKILHFFIPSKLRASNVISRIILLDAFFFKLSCKAQKKLPTNQFHPTKSDQTNAAGFLVLALQIGFFIITQVWAKVTFLIKFCLLLKNQRVWTKVIYLLFPIKSI